MNTHLRVLQRIAEQVSQEYEINWDEWDTTETDKMKQQLDENMPEYEKRFITMMNDTNLSTEDYPDYAGELVDNLIYGYALQIMIEKHSYIEDLLASV
jgi:hypothetical protein